MHPAGTAVTAAGDRAPRERTSTGDRVGSAAVALLTLVVLLTWTPSLAAGLGDNHEGRILGRHALHVSNAHADGLVASGWLSDASPAFTHRYAHHPPLMNLGYYGATLVLPGDDDLALRLFAYATGVAALPLAAALLRRLGFGWAPVLLALGAVAVTPLFWAYARLSANVSLLLAMTLMVARVGEDREIPTRELVVACVVSFAAIVAGYLGMAMGAMLGLWLLVRRRLDRVTIAVGVAMVLAAAVSLAYILGNSEAGEMAAQLEFRTRGGAFTFDEFWERMDRWFTELLPGWWLRWLLPVSLLALALDRRTRVLGTFSTLLAFGYVFGLPNGSFVHDYWIYPFLLPVLFGTAAIVAAVTERLPRTATPYVAGAAGVALVIAGVGTLRGEDPHRLFRAPEAAGTLVRELPPTAGQQQAWRTTGMSTPRWLSYYWDLPSSELEDRDDLDEVPGEDRVLVRLDRRPGWLDDARDALEAAAIRVEGDYAVLTGDELRTLADASADG